MKNIDLTQIKEFLKYLLNLIDDYKRDLLLSDPEMEHFKNEINYFRNTVQDAYF